MIKKLSSNSNLLCVSPDEIIPEKYREYIKLNNKNDWRILELPKEYNIGDVKNDIYSIPRDNYIREIINPLDILIWCACSKNLGFPEGYSQEILDENGWIKRGNWTLFCLGPSNCRDEVIEGFKSILTKDIIFDYDNTIRRREIWGTRRRSFLYPVFI